MAEAKAKQEAALEEASSRLKAFQSAHAFQQEEVKFTCSRRSLRSGTPDFSKLSAYHKFGTRLYEMRRRNSQFYAYGNGDGSRDSR